MKKITIALISINIILSIGLIYQIFNMNKLIAILSSNGVEETSNTIIIGDEEVIYYDSKDDNNFYIRGYYNKKGEKVATTYGYSYLDDCVMDFDNDGKNELISNCMSSTDGHMEIFIYKIIDSIPYVGTVQWREQDLPNLDYWGKNAVQTHFLAEENECWLGYEAVPLDGKRNTQHLRCEKMITYKPYLCESDNSF